MSRIGKLPIHVPAGVTVEISETNLVTVKGPKGTLTQQVDPKITVKQEAGVVSVERQSEDKQHRAMHGLYRALIYNMVVGVTDGFTKTLEMVGTGYKAKAENNGQKLNIAIGFSHPVVLDAPAGITFATPNDTTIQVQGANKQQVGNLAADIRAIRKPEPYLGKGIKYQGEHIRRKEGKTGKKMIGSDCICSKSVTAMRSARFAMRAYAKRSAAPPKCRVCPFIAPTGIFRPRSSMMSSA